MSSPLVATHFEGPPSSVGSGTVAGCQSHTEPLLSHRFLCLLNEQKGHLPCGDLATTEPRARQKAGARLSISPWQDNVSLFLYAGLAPLNALDGKPYTSILYGNGPGYVGTGERPNVTVAESSECSGVACLKVQPGDSRQRSSP